MRVRLRDVAERAGVSVKTVSNVVNGYEHVSPATRRRVQAALDALHYRPNLSARSLRGGRSGVIALALPALDMPYFAELVQHVVRAAEELGYTVLVDQTDGLREREELVVAGIRSHLIDGLVLSPVAMDAEELLSARDETPMVLLGEKLGAAGDVDHVAFDNVAGARAATEHLVSLGRTRVAAIGYQDRAHAGSGVAALRRAGYEAALRAHDLPVDPRLTAVVSTYRRAQGAAAMAQLLDSGARPDAVFCFNDLLALGALRTLAERGIDVPGQVAVIGVDDIEDGRYSSPTLSTVAPDKEAVARQAVHLLHDRLRAVAPVPGREVRVSFTVRLRESTQGSSVPGAGQTVTPPASGSRPRRTRAAASRSR